MYSSVWKSHSPSRIIISRFSGLPVVAAVLVSDGRLEGPEVKVQHLPVVLVGVAPGRKDEGRGEHAIAAFRERGSASDCRQSEACCGVTEAWVPPRYSAHWAKRLSLRKVNSSAAPMT